jgi:hypothetical protein
MKMTVRIFCQDRGEAKNLAARLRRHGMSVVQQTTRVVIIKPIEVDIDQEKIIAYIHRKGL